MSQTNQHSPARPALFAWVLLALLTACGGGGGGGGGEQAPVANDVTATVIGGSTQVTITLDGSTTSGAAPHYVLIGTASMGIVNIEPASGVATIWLPQATQNGTVTFQYTVTDGHRVGNTATATLTILPDVAADPLLVSVSKRLSNASTGTVAHHHRAISDDGRYVAFSSDASDLTALRHEGSSVFVRDLHSGAIEVVSVSTDGNAARDGMHPLLSADGNLVLFLSRSDDLIDNDTNGAYDIFLRDRQAGTTVRISQQTDGTESPAPSLNYDMSPDGRFIAFVTGAAPLTDDDVDGDDSLYLLDRQTNSLTYIAQGEATNHIYYRPQVSDDGRYVLFATWASLADDDLNGGADVYLWDGQADTITGIGLENRTYDNSECFLPTLSGDGTVVMFASRTSALFPSATGDRHCHYYIYRPADGSLSLLDQASIAGSDGNRPSLQLSNDGRYCIYTIDNDLETLHQIRRRDLLTGADVPVTGEGFAVDAALSGDARFATFLGQTEGVVPGDDNDEPDAFWVDILVGPASIRRVSEIPPDRLPVYPDRPVTLSAISGDGRFVVMYTEASNMLTTVDDNNDEDVIRYDCDTGNNLLVSIRDDGSPSFRNSRYGSISDDGNLIAFGSYAPLQTGMDTNNNLQVYLHNIAAGTIRLLSRSTDGSGGGDGNAGTGYGAPISADGRTVVFSSSAANLTDDTVDGFYSQIFACDTATGAITLVSVSTTAGVAGELSSENPKIAADGSSCVFLSIARDLISDDPGVFGMRKAFQANLITGEITCVSLANDGSFLNNLGQEISASDDGRRIVFIANQSNVTDEVDDNGTLDVYLRDQTAGTTVLISRSAINANRSADGRSTHPHITGDGAFIAFASDATDLIDGDTNGTTDIFVYDCATAAISRVAENAEVFRMSADGAYIVYQSLADGWIYRTATLLTAGG